jgi:DivIVA domain-containing protein
VDADNQLARMIAESTFSTGRLHEGYATQDVDDLLDRMVAAARAERDVSWLATGPALRRVRWREGYDIGEVDAFLRLVVDVVEGRADVPPAPPPEPPGLFARLVHRG